MSRHALQLVRGLQPILPGRHFGRGIVLVRTGAGASGHVAGIDVRSGVTRWRRSAAEYAARLSTLETWRVRPVGRDLVVADLDSQRILLISGRDGRLLASHKPHSVCAIQTWNRLVIVVGARGRVEILSAGIVGRKGSIRTSRG